ncbi:MAG TPA: toprim domain-containing protein, partial [Burkholderiales bacterium]|nr:toprim domain-containing protein [Burkholderiales bacterium]
MKPRPSPEVPSPQGVERLVEALRVLPGVGPRSAQRMAYHLLQHDRSGASQLAQALSQALETVRRCTLCNNFSEDELCLLCRSPRRDRSLLCIVETPADLATVEHTLSYSGMYFVLMGRLSPL